MDNQVHNQIVSFIWGIADIVINQSHSYALRGFSLQNFQDAVPHNAFLHDEIFQKYVLLGFFAYGGGQRPLVRSRTAAVRSE